MAAPSVGQPYTLPCGLTLRNRLVKAALAEGLASRSTADPNDKHAALYGAWARGGWGAVITGNVQVDVAHLGSPGDVAVHSATANGSKDSLARWRQYATESQQHGVPTLVQLNHPGRQAPRLSRSGNAIAPSALPLTIGDGYVASVMRSIAFGTPVAMTAADIATVVQQFADAAKFVHEAGFKGIQIHAAHGYLLAQFLSKRSNVRDDAYGGSAANRARILREVVDAVRAAVPADFCVGIKINSADHQYEGGLEECLEQVKTIVTGGGIDFLEISGGSYEKPRMMESEWAHANEGAESHETEGVPRGGELKPTERTAKREAFFLEYAEQVRARFPDLPLMVTGGFRTRQGMQSALQSGACDIIGLGRPAVVQPELPNKLILSDKVADEQAVISLDPVKVPWLVRFFGLKPLSAGLVTIHFQQEMRKLIKTR